MKNFFDNLAGRLASFMVGRNGMDTLALWSMGAGIIVTFIDVFVGSMLLSLIGLALLLYSLFRCYSRNVSARRAENDKFDSLIHGRKKKAQQTKTHWENRKTTKYFTCEECGQSLSVPKGKGKLRVTCPKCHHQTQIKS